MNFKIVESAVFVPFGNVCLFQKVQAFVFFIAEAAFGDSVSFYGF
jgi:hypothetical protein